MTHTSFAAKDATYTSREPTADKGSEKRDRAAYEFVVDGNDAGTSSGLIAYASSRVWG